MFCVHNIVLVLPLFLKKHVESVECIRDGWLHQGSCDPWSSPLVIEAMPRRQLTFQLAGIGHV